MDSIEAKDCFGKIDQLQYETYSRIREIVEASEPSLPTSKQDDEEGPSAGTINQTIELRRAELVKTAARHIKDASDLLKLVELRVGEHEDAESLRVQIYHEKVSNLKVKLRECQLKSYGLENELIHKQRIARFVTPIVKRSDRFEDEAEARDALFAGRSANGAGEAKNSNTKTVKDQILTQNKNITNSLQSTRQLMSTSVMQTELNIDSVSQQSKDLSTLNEKLIDLNQVLHKSRQIVRFIEKQDKQDKKRIYMSIGFLAVCCAWVIWRRMLKLPVKIVLWFLFKGFGVFSWATRPQRKLVDPIEVYATVDDVTNSISTSTTISNVASFISTSTTISDITSSISIETDWETTSPEWKDEYVQEISGDSHEYATWDGTIETTQRIADEL